MWDQQGRLHSSSPPQGALGTAYEYSWQILVFFQLYTCFLGLFPGVSTGASSALSPLVSKNKFEKMMDPRPVTHGDNDEGSLEGEMEGDRADSCGGGRGGKNSDGCSHQPPHQVLPPEFNACFSTNTRKMRWGLWCPHDRQWMQLVKDNYEKHHRRRRQRQGVPPQTQEGYRSPRGTYVPYSLIH